MTANEAVGYAMAFFMVSGGVSAIALTWAICRRRK